MKIQKIKDKVKIFDLDVEAQSCDCAYYTNTRAVGEPPNVTEPPAVTICSCSSHKVSTSDSWTFW